MVTVFVPPKLHKRLLNLRLHSRQPLYELIEAAINLLEVERGK